jgi:hypothetical protein
MKTYTGKTNRVKNAGRLAGAQLAAVIAFLAGFTIGVMI